VLDGAAVRAVALTRDGALLASAQADTVRIWDVRAGQVRHVLSGHTERVEDVAFSRDGLRLVTASSSQATHRVAQAHQWPQNRHDGDPRVGERFALAQVHDCSNIRSAGGEPPVRVARSVRHGHPVSADPNNA
jgi:WD40 repeat protein